MSEAKRLCLSVERSAFLLLEVISCYHGGMSAKQKDLLNASDLAVWMGSRGGTVTAAQIASWRPGIGAAQRKRMIAAAIKEQAIKQLVVPPTGSPGRPARAYTLLDSRSTPEP